LSQFHQRNRSPVGKIIVIVGSRLVEPPDFLLIWVETSWLGHQVGLL